MLSFNICRKLSSNFGHRNSEEQSIVTTMMNLIKTNQFDYQMISHQSMNMNLARLLEYMLTILFRQISSWISLNFLMIDSLSSNILVENMKGAISRYTMKSRITRVSIYQMNKSPYEKNIKQIEKELYYTKMG